MTTQEQVENTEEQEKNIKECIYEVREALRKAVKTQTDIKRGFRAWKAKNKPPRDWDEWDEMLKKYQEKYKFKYRWLWNQAGLITSLHIEYNKLRGKPYDMHLYKDS